MVWRWSVRGLVEIWGRVVWISRVLHAEVSALCTLRVLVRRWPGRGGVSGIRALTHRELILTLIGSVRWRLVGLLLRLLIRILILIVGHFALDGQRANHFEGFSNRQNCEAPQVHPPIQGSGPFCSS